MPGDRLFIAKLLTLAVALGMLIFNVVRYRQDRNSWAASRIKTFSLLAIAAGLLLAIHPYGPYSAVYVVGLLFVGAVVVGAVYCEYRAWHSH